MSAEAIIDHPGERLFTALEYLERERIAETKSEFHGGRIVAMSGVSPEHDHVVFDLSAEVAAQLKNSPCEGATADLRVRIRRRNRYFYPDLIVYCDTPSYEVVKGVKSLLNPTMIVEVLSPLTALMDRGEKWLCYQSIDSLKTYVLISQDEPLIEIYDRVDDMWRYRAIPGTHGHVKFDAIGCDVAIADIYRRVNFAPQPADAPETGDGL